MATPSKGASFRASNKVATNIEATGVEATSIIPINSNKGSYTIQVAIVL